MGLPNAILAGLCALALAAATVAAPKPGDATKGKEVFEQCASCHRTDSTDKKVGPGLKGLFQRPKLASGKPVTDENVLNRVNTGGEGMPPFKDLLSDKERADLLAYLKTL
jgi:cytochrome c2